MLVKQEKLENIKVCFVILHYNDLDTTLNCIDSIIKTIVYKNYNIVVVDNASPNKSGKMLKKRFNDNPLVHILLNDRNEGFAKGNNLGYDYSKKTLLADFIVCINNDTLMIQHDFIQQVFLIENEEHCDVLGPDIISKRGIKQNPLRLNRLKKKEIYQGIIRKGLVVLYLYFKKFFIPIRMIEKKREQDTTKRMESISNNSRKNSIENPVLMGACIIFCPQFVKNEKYAFNPNTKMYGEEDLLAEYCYMKSYRMFFSSNIKIIHLGEMSTNSQKQNSVEKELFFCKNTLKGLILLLQIKNR